MYRTPQAVTKNGSVLSCFGCSPHTTGAYCANLSKPEITHHYCFETRSRDTSQCTFGLPLEQSHLSRGFHLFGPTIPRVLNGSVASLSDKTAGKLRELWWAVLEAQTITFNGGGFRRGAHLGHVLQ